MPHGIHDKAKPCRRGAWRALSTETTWFTLIPLSVIGVLAAAGFLCGKEALHPLETVPWLLALVVGGCICCLCWLQRQEEQRYGPVPIARRYD